MFNKGLIFAAFSTALLLTSSGKAGRTLEGTEWRLKELAGASVVHLPDAQGATITLHADGKRLSGSSGCNRIVGGYELSGQSLRFTPAGLTRMMCPEPLMKQETAFTEALRSTTTYRLVGDKLDLLDGDRVLASFKSSGAATASSATDKWLGQWNGPEGTYLVLSKDGDKYLVEIHSLDGARTFEGDPHGDRILFTRDGKAESIHAGGGGETGMKWLLDKKNCLVIRTGEAFCRE